MSSSSDRLRTVARSAVSATRRRWARATRLRNGGRRATLAARALPHRAEARRRSARLRATLARNGPPPAPIATTVVRLDLGSAAVARALAAADTPFVTLTLDTNELLGTAVDAHLAAALTGGVALAAPLIVHPCRPVRSATPRDATVRARGLTVSVHDGEPRVTALAAGTDPDPNGPPATVAAVTGAYAVVERTALLAAGGLAGISDPDAAMLDLCRRLAACGYGVAVVPRVAVVDHRPVADPADPDAPFATTGRAWSDLLAAHGPALRRWAGDCGPPSFAITVAAPTARIAERWGDWHLAEALARALRACGHDARIAAFDRADAPATRCADVHLVVRGLASVPRTPGQRHVLWVISHPEAVTPAECDTADLVLVASPLFAEHLRTRTRTPVEVMLQATDAGRFHPRPPDPRYAHDVVVVAKSRNVHRRMVADAVAAGIRPAIYGSGWERFTDPALIVADRIDNSELPAVYASAGVLLNDHWDSMREWGFVSNRIFDALACGTPVVSDPVAGLATLFGDAVVTVENPAGLRAAVDAALADPKAARTRAARGGDAVRAAHTFTHRADQLLDALHRHGLDAGRPSD